MEDFTPNTNRSGKGWLVGLIIVVVLLLAGTAGFMLGMLGPLPTSNASALAKEAQTYCEEITQIMSSVEENGYTSTMTAIKDKEKEIEQTLSTIPSDTTDTDLQTVRETLETEIALCDSAYTTLSTAGEEGREEMQQYADELNALLPKLQKYQ